VIEQAKRRGIELEPGEVSFGLGWVQVKDAKLSLVGLPGIRAKAGIIDVELARMTPQRFTLNDVKVEATGSASGLQGDLSSWLRAHEAQFTEPVFMKPVEVQYRQQPSGGASMAITGGEISASHTELDVKASRFTIEGHELGAMKLTGKKSHVELAMTLGLSDIKNPTLDIEATVADGWKLHVALAPVLLGRLGAALNTAMPLPAVTASGTFDLDVPRVLTPGAHPSGRVDATLKGYVPPHPVELDGFVFGDTTELGSKFTVVPEQLKLLLEETRVKAGSFVLQGAGSVAVEAGGPRLRLNLSGALPCGALAGAAAQTRLGTALGRLTGKAARETLSGSVGVHVVVEADVLNLDNPRVLKTITPGCGLKPLTLAELRALGELLPDALDPRVADDLAKLLKNPLALPQLPPDTNLDLSRLPKLPLPVLPLPAPPTPAPAKPSKPSTARPPASAH
ncbi:MAG TPA: hypothetical protein VFQ35_21585, partial [Polyangiaceae bacterium]|nr:hypothetical protein [Polyangiaceae bacterium]